MARSIALRLDSSKARPVRSNTESALTRRLLIASALVFLGLFLFLPLMLVFTYAFREGLGIYLSSFITPDALSAIRLSLITAAIAVPLNTLFGVAAA